MAIRSIALIGLLCAGTAHAETTFPMGDGLEKWGMPIRVPDSELALRLGARFQSLASIVTEENLNADTENTTHDFQSRRIRFQFQAVLRERITYYMDIRNDNANAGVTGGEKNFKIGDAYFHIPLSEENTSHAVRLFRAKVDVSRTETVSSSELLFVNRPYIADYAANFVSHNRRATNVQILGNFAKKLTYQLVVGDGVAAEQFFDAQGTALSKTSGQIERQNFMMGGKLRFHPIPGWEMVNLTETYFGKGKHFSMGAGFFNTSKIRIVDGTTENTLNRNLFNGELTAHYGEWSFFSEYFKMQGVVEELGVANFNVGSGEGWFVQGEKLFTNFHYLAPFLRYEKWNRFLESGDYMSESNMLGLNWYLNGNRFRVTLAYERNRLGESIEGHEERVEAYHLASMWHF